MTFPLVLFILSGLTIVALLLHARAKLSNGKGLRPLHTISGLDERVSGTTEKIKSQISLINKNNVFKIVNDVFVVFVRALLAIVEWVRNHIHTLYEKAKNEKPKLSGNGHSSVYLKHISEAKEDKTTPL